MQIGDVVSFTSVKRVGRTSVTVDVEVYSERNRGTTVVKVTEAELTYVAIGADRKTARAAAGQRDRAGSRAWGAFVAHCDTARFELRHPPVWQPDAAHKNAPA